VRVRGHFGLRFLALITSEYDAIDSPCLSAVLSCYPVERNSASRCADHRAVGGEGDDRPAMQQPDQPGDVMAAQAVVARPTLLRRVMKTK
jgi:hypothetical protein